MNALFFAQALNEVQICFVVLHAVVANRVGPVQVEGVGIAENAVLLEEPGNDLLDCQLLEHALVGAMLEVGQLRHQGQGVNRQALAGLALGNGIDEPVNAASAVGIRQKGRGMQQCHQIQIGPRADQYQLEGIRRADGLITFE